MSDQHPVVNVASVPQRSPFRYPGGKSWLIPTARQWFAAQAPRPALLIEPFAGGASIGLLAAFENYADKVLLVERDPDIAAVWITILNERDSDWLARRILAFNLTRESAIAELSVHARSTKRIAFQTILRNRVQHGGIMAKGAGLVRDGENGKGVTCRWYPETLARRIRAITEHHERLAIVEGDALTEIARHGDNPAAALFIDPPYTASAKNAGKRLYNHNTVNHEALFNLAAQHPGNVLMTYDDDANVRTLCDTHQLDYRHVLMQNTHLRAMNELLIARNLDWLSPR